MYAFKTLIAARIFHGVTPFLRAKIAQIDVATMKVGEEAVLPAASEDACVLALRGTGDTNSVKEGSGFSSRGACRAYPARLKMSRIQIVLWAPAYRRFSSPDIGQECETEAGAFAVLYERIAADAGPFQYLNQIYDNAPVELEPDNMEEIVVRDHYQLCMVYTKENAVPEDGAAGLTLYPEGQPRNPVGMMYVKKPIEGSEPHFEEYLEKLARRE